MEMTFKELLNKAFKENTDNTFIQLFRYVFVGGTAFIVDYGVLALLNKALGVQYLLAAGISFILGLIANYMLSVTWVFNSKTLDNRYVEFAVFAVIGIVGLGLNELIMYLFTGKLGLDPLVSKLISTAIVFFWNFFARKIALFSPRRKDITVESPDGSDIENNGK
ncbi:MAG: GtrA family protein [Bacteroidales bacterium]|jgi:putative flippase GtrA|nr:GtrA family protein [Bacteroidales bacterium]MCI2145061.1 GtrA family protein [Bacteroidales bacterium]